MTSGVGDKDFWNDEMEALFLQSFITGGGGKGNVIRPVGPFKHFAMLIAYHRFSQAIGRNVDIELLWNKLESLYDLDLLEKSMVTNTPEVEFKLPFKLPNLEQTVVQQSIKRPASETSDEEQPSTKKKRRRRQ